MKKVLIGLAVILIIGGVGMMIFGGIKYGAYFGYENYNTVEAIEEDFDKVDISVFNNYVMIEKGETNEIRYNDAEINELEYEVNDGTLKVTNFRRLNAFNKGYILNLVLNSEDYENLYVKTVNAPISVKDLDTAKAMTMTTINGKISIENVKTPAINAGTTNAEIEIKNVMTNNLKLTGSNGAIKVENSDLSQVNAKTMNAKINIDNSVFKGDAVLTTSNAKINVNGSKFDNVNFVTANGSIEVVNTQGAKMKLQTSNSQIEVESVKCSAIQMITSNAKIVSENLETIKAVARTSNGNIRLKLKGSEKNYSFETSGSGIDELGDYIIATKTNNGKVNIDFTE